MATYPPMGAPGSPPPPRRGPSEDYPSQSDADGTEAEACLLDILVRAPGPVDLVTLQRQSGLSTGQLGTLLKILSERGIVEYRYETGTDAVALKGK